jgi:hypothetical protein
VRGTTIKRFGSAGPNRFHFESHGDMIGGHDPHQYPAFDGEWTVVDGLFYLIPKDHGRLTLRSS